jgi:Tfp pilus assembly protein PilN
MITFRSLTQLFGWPLCVLSLSTIAIGSIAVLAIVLGGRPLEAQEKKPTTENVRELEQQQKQLARRFGQLEELLIRMSELEAAANPTRAGLLLQAAQMSKQLATLQRLSVAPQNPILPQV